MLLTHQNGFKLLVPEIYFTALNRTVLPYPLPQILHLREKPGFLRIANGKNLKFSLRNPVFLVLLRMVHSGQSYAASTLAASKLIQKKQLTTTFAEVYHQIY
jgi:hypothetical protein